MTNILCKDLTCSDLSGHRKTLSASCDPQSRPFSLLANIDTQDRWFSHKSRNPERFHVRNITTDNTQSYQNPEIDRAGDDEISFQSDISIWSRYGGRKTQQSSPFSASWGLVEAALERLSSSPQSTREP